MSLEIIINDQAEEFLKENKLEYNPQHESRDALMKELANFRLKLANLGYLTGSLDSLVTAQTKNSAYFSAGETFTWANLIPGDIDEELLNRTGYRLNTLKGKPFHYGELVKMQEAALAAAENNGYPFAVVWLDSIEIKDNNSISAKLNVKKNLYVTFKGIEIQGEDVKISNRFLQNYLDIRAGEPYSLEKVKNVPKLLRDLPFLQETRSSKVSFRGSEATVNLFLKKKKASKFDFLLGFLPRSQETGSRLLLTVDGMFATRNLLGAGESIRLEFRQLKPETQRLDVEAGYPYIFGTSFGVDGDFSLYKRDSTFLDLEYDAGVSYLFDARHSLKAFWRGKRSFLLVIDEDNILDTRTLPENLDTELNDFGLEHRIERLDYRFNPRKGFSFTTRASAGFKSVKTNNSIINLEDPDDPEFRFASLYDSLDTRTVQYQIGTDWQWFVPLFPEGRGTFMLGNKTGAFIAPTPIFNNERFRIGGMKVLRGFDEESVNASLYSVFTAEYRILLGQNSYVHTFFDYGLVRSKTQTELVNDTPFGFGAGLNFDTRVGVFGITYAYGKQFDNPIDFRAAKIHFGYINYF